MNKEQFEDLQDRVANLMDLYEDIKHDIKHNDRHLFERWKAGGFCIDSDIMSMYPNLEAVVEALEVEEDNEN